VKRAISIAAVIALLACGGAKLPDQEAVVAPTPTTTCPPGTIYNGVGCATPLADLEKDAGDAPPRAVTGPGVLGDDARDPRPLARSPRRAALLVQEIHNLESLLAIVAVNAVDHPTLLRRVGDAWFELSYAEAADGHAAVAQEARRKAIAAYDTFVRDHPNAPNADDVIYFLGYAYELLGDMSAARKTYYLLIQRYPSSQWIGGAYYAFGDLFLKEARSDPSKADLAVQAFEEVLKFPNSAARPWALLGLGEAHQLAGRDAKAQAAFQRLRRDFPGHPATAKTP
jgi:tetratricopeptide (TPR) repeat protein